MIRSILVSPDLAQGRTLLSLRTLAANENAPLEAISPLRRPDSGADRSWPALKRASIRQICEKI